MIKKKKETRKYTHKRQYTDTIGQFRYLVDKLGIVQISVDNDCSIQRVDEVYHSNLNDYEKVGNLLASPNYYVSLYS